MALAAVGTAATISNNKRMADAQAAQDRRNADLLEVQKSQQKRKLEEERRKMISAQRAAYGASGVQFAGTPSLVSSHTAGEFGREIANTEFGIGVQQEGLLASAEQARINGNARNFNALASFGGSVLNYANSA